MDVASGRACTPQNAKQLKLYKYLKTAECYLQIIWHFSDFTTHITYLEEVTVDLIKRYVKSRVGRVKNNTINSELVVLNGLFKFAEDKSYIIHNPVPKVKRLPVKPKKIKYFSKEELNSILVKTRIDYPDFYEVFIFFAYTGCRRGELIHLEWDDVDLE